MRLFPLGDRVLVQPLQAPSMSDGGVILTLRPKDEANMGRVVAKGNLVTSVTPGCRVVFRSGKYESITIEGQALLVMRDGDLDAVVGVA